MVILLRAVGLLVGVLLGDAHAGTVSLSVQPHTAVLGEAVTLQFSEFSAETDQQETVEDPDFSPLTSLFDLGGQSKSTQIRVINGVSSQTRSWSITAFPKQAGELTIPAIRFGQLSSKAQTLSVTDTPPAARHQDDIQLQLVADINSAHVQQQIKLTQRVLYTTALHQNNRSLTVPEITLGKGNIRQVGQATFGQRQHNGVNTHVIERQYLLFPTQSGELEIGRTLFTGLKPGTASQRRNQFDPFGRQGTPIRAYSKPLRLEIQPQPNEFQGGVWLPAENLSLTAAWKPISHQVMVGIPGELVVSIKANGLLSEQLPQLPAPNVDGLKIYAQAPTFKDDVINGKLVGSREEHWTIIPTHPGAVNLPEQRVDWWNINTHQNQHSLLAPFQIQVSGEVLPNEDAPAAHKETTTDPTTAVPKAVTPKPLSQRSTPTTYWFVLMGLIGLGVTAAWIGRDRIQNRIHQRLIEKQSLKAIKAACDANDARAAEAALVQWIQIDQKASVPYLHYLTTIAPPELAHALKLLTQARYAPDPADWQGTALWQALSEYRQQPKNHITTNPALPELYPLYK